MKIKYSPLLIVIIFWIFIGCTTVRPLRKSSSITNSIGMNFVSIEASFFQKCCPVDSAESDRDDYSPKKDVRIYRDYYIQTTEVTQKQWQAVMESNPSLFKDCGDQCPVENVSWDDVQKFIEKLNKIEKDYQYRLPTETEWEYACRANSSARYYFGDEASLLDYYAWHRYNSDYKPHSVGQKTPNQFGIYDMYGNVAEWCIDRITYGKRKYYVNRGGTFLSEPRKIGSHSWYRNSSYHSDGTLGFRLILIK